MPAPTTLEAQPTVISCGGLLCTGRTQLAGLHLGAVVAGNAAAGRVVAVIAGIAAAVG